MKCAFQLIYPSKNVLKMFFVPGKEGSRSNCFSDASERSVHCVAAEIFLCCLRGIKMFVVWRSVRRVQPSATKRSVTCETSDVFPEPYHWRRIAKETVRLSLSDMSATRDMLSVAPNRLNFFSLVMRHTRHSPPKCVRFPARIYPFWWTFFSPILLLYSLRRSAQAYLFSSLWLVLTFLS